MVSASTEQFGYAIPASINLDELIEEHPPSFLFRRHAALWLLEQITAHGSSRSSFAPLRSTRLKKVVSNYHKYLDYFKECGLIECDNHYVVPGKLAPAKAIGYRFTATVSSVLQKQFDIPIRVPNGSRATIPCKCAGYVNNPVFVDASELTSAALLNRMEDPTQRRRAQYWGIVIADRWYCKKSMMTGRIITPVTNMQKILRPFLQIAGDDHLSDLDVKACHPFLLVIEARKCRVPSGVIAEWTRLVTEGDVYEEFGRRLQDAGESPMRRDQLKVELLKVFNSPNESRSRRKKVFREWMPDLAATLNHLKAKDHRAFARTLMSHESDIMYQYVQPRLEELHVPCFIVHDGILVRTVDANATALVLREEFTKIVQEEAVITIEELTKLF